MPNGGSDCCGTCWFNRKNHGQRDWLQHADDSITAHCEIRDVAIEAPFYTYCANHPHRRPDRDPVPIGPVMRNISGGESNDREVWKLSPDSEEIRLHLLEMFDEFFTHVAADRYPIGPSLAGAIMWQLGEFREQRAVRHLEWISANCPDFLAEPARGALERIRG